jgi:biopolymer transport protein TolR
MAMAVSSGGGGGRRRGRRRGGGNAAMSDINVTPMVDVMLVLLIVFMVAAPLLTVGVPIDLPKTEAKELNTDSKPVTVTVKPDGSIYLAGGTPGSRDDNAPVALEDLIADIEPLTSNGTDDRIYLRGDTAANYGAVMKVMGVLSKAGFAKIGLITDQAQAEGR